MSERIRLLERPRPSPPAQANGVTASDDRELFLLRLRYREGRLVTVGANKTVLLDDPEMAWVVLSGSAQVFAVAIEDGRPVGARRHVFGATDGVALFGMELQARQVGLLVSGAPGTQLVRITRSKLAKLADSSEFVGAVARLIDSWVDGLSLALSRGLPPREATRLVAGQELDVGDRAIVRAREGVLWIAHRAGGSQLLGRAELSFVAGDVLAPLASHAWLETTDSARLEAVETTTALARQAAWPALDRFHESALTCLAVDGESDARAHLERLGERSRLERARLEVACSRLAAVLAPPSAWSAIELAGQDPLLAACQLVGSAMGINMTPARRAMERIAERDRVGAIARASRVRLRRVALRGAWWTRESGPMLGFLQLDDERRPVCLLPADHGYDLHDPVARSRTPVSPGVAATLDPFAYTFYRRFKDSALTVRDLAAFGLEGCRTDLVMLLLLAVGTGLLGALLPLVTASLFDRAIPGGQRSVLLQLTAGLAVAALVAALFGATRELAILRVTGKMGGAVQAAVIDRLLDLPIAFFRQYTAGDLAGRALGISTMQQLLSGAVLTAMLSGVLSLSSLGVLFLLDARLALVVSALVLALIASAGIAGRLELHAQRRLGELAGRLAGVVLQLINGVAKVRVAGAESRVFALWATAFAEQRRVAYSARVVGNRLAVFNAAYPILASMVVFGAAAVVLDPRPSTATVLAFIVALGQLNIAAAGLMQTLGAIVQAVPAYERAQPIFQSLPEVDATRADPGELSGAINLDHVSFRYSPNGPLILDDVSLRFRPGEFVAVVGPSGSGKSTLLRLLLGFEAPESGAILYDGQDLATLDLRSVRRQIGSVLQTSRLMSGDILSNIVGASAATPDDAWEAVHMAGLEQDLREMPMRLQTVITAGGGTLSGGQRQRLLIARAIVARPRILLFDEATSALDNRTQALVSRGLEHLAATRVVIAHRLSTILNADHIYVLQAGRVVESGNYRELMQRRGLFAELARRQIT